ncbi:MAG: hypothetical protein JWP97_2648 [Labilithrix sp.]|nr:hypothetical protein [Labilithrix sp.]
MKSFVFPGGLVLAVALATSAAGCGKDPPKKPIDEPKTATPVPSDMVFNDFVPSNGGPGITGVKTDGGMLEGGMADTPAAAGEPADAPGADPAGAGGGAKMKVTDPGAEPRSPRKYSFGAGKVDKRVMTVRQSAVREGSPEQGQTFAVTADFTPKAVKPAGARFEMKVLKIDIPDLPAAQKAQATAQLAAFNGLAGQFDVSAHGDVGEVDFKADERMQGGGAEVILQSLQQALEVAVAPLPTEAIGTGAKWESTVARKERGQEMTIKKTFTLAEVSADGGTVDATVEISVPKHPFQARGAPPGATEELNGKGTYQYVFKFDHIATKVNGEMTLNHRIEAPAGAGAPKQGATEVIKLKNTLDAVPGK